MNALDKQVLDDLAALPGWDELTATPAASVSPEALARSAAAVRSAITADVLPAMTGGTVHAGPRPATGARRRRTRVVLAVSAGAAAAALVIVAPTVITPGEHAPTSVASASEYLTRLASTATAAPGIDDAYWKVRWTTISPTMAATGADRPTTTTMWFGREGGRWLTTDDGKAVKVSDRGAPFVVGTRAALTWSQIRALPSDAAQLERRLHALAGEVPVAASAARLLTGAPLDAAQRSALFTILSRQPGVAIRGGIEDAAGRTGTALAFPFGTAVVTLVLAGDGTLLELIEESPHVGPASAAPRATGSSPSTSGAPATDKASNLDRAIYLYLAVGGTNAAPGT
jgi:hypothetical protein